MSVHPASGSALIAPMHSMLLNCHRTPCRCKIRPWIPALAVAPRQTLTTY